MYKRQELGEDNTQSDAEQYEESLKKLKAPKEVKERIQKEIDRFKNISSSSSESAVTRGYIETLDVYKRQVMRSPKCGNPYFGLLCLKENNFVLCL